MPLSSVAPTLWPGDQCRERSAGLAGPGMTAPLLTPW